MNRPADAVRRWGWPALAALAVVAAGAVVALLQPAPAGYLDPSGTGPTGARALTDLLAARGQQVLRVATPDSSTTATRELELVTSPNLLTSSQLTQVARFRGDLLVLDPDPIALRALAPGSASSAIRPSAPPAPTARPGPPTRPAWPTRPASPTTSGWSATPT